MTEAALWHPVASLDELGGAPHAVRLLERELVLWCDEARDIHAWLDRCPHRGTRLSMGRVTAGRLECAYHGWQFDGRGQCVAIPALPGFVPPATHAASGYLVRTAFGLAWVRLQDSNEAIPVIDGVPERQVMCGAGACPRCQHSCRVARSGLAGSNRLPPPPYWGGGGGEEEGGPGGGGD